jgi:phospholipase C
MSSPIEHLVVLMFENRSFDSLLGFHQRPAGADPFRGLTGTETNPLATGGTAQVAKLSGLDGYVTDPDPHHEHQDAMFHLDGDASIPATLGQNLGFAARYQTSATKGVQLTAEVAQQVMNVFDTRAQLPALAALVDDFRVCDAWFASLPGPTWPNRFFAHCASSGGLFESPGDFSTIWSEVGSVFNMPTIFENLSAASRSWNVYYHDIPQALALARLHHYRGQLKHFASFLRDCDAGTLPSYSFIEPGFFDAKLLNVAANDMHPMHDVRRGDALIASVYNALRANDKLWEKSMLLVLWDEHGGFHDHVPPPATVTPDAASAAAAFKFDRLGVRVPAVVVSPWVRKGSTDSRRYDHSAIPATLKRLFAIPAFLTHRDAQANAFDGDLLDDPRDDTPESIPTVDLSGVLPRNESALHAHHEGLLAMASRLVVPGLIAPAVTDVEAAILHAARYLDV